MSNIWNKLYVWSVVNLRKKKYNNKEKLRAHDYIDVMRLKDNETEKKKLN